MSVNIPSGAFAGAGIASRDELRAGRPTIRGSIPSRSGSCFLLQSVQIASGIHTASYSNGAWRRPTTHHHLVPSWGRSSTVPYAVMAYTRTPLLRMVRSHGKIAVVQIKGGMGGSQFTAPISPFICISQRDVTHKKTVVIRLLDTPQLSAREPPEDFFF